MVDGASEAAVSAVTASASATPVTSAHLLSASSSSSSSINNAAAGGGSTIRKIHDSQVPAGFWSSDDVVVGAWTRCIRVDVVDDDD